MFCHNSIIKGLQIDDPKVFLRWNMKTRDIGIRSCNQSISCVTDNYYVIEDAKLFNYTLCCNVGLHFNKRLKSFEFFRSDYKDLNQSYTDFQAIIVNKFGEPSKRNTNATSFEYCEWELSSKIKIYHYVLNRFGLEEHLTIAHS
jgi:hypothetical protein